MEKDNLENNSGKWIWGIFYYNKEDDRIFPPKRIPWMGWTVNFANWKSIAALVAMLAFFYFIIFMIERNS
ncbi:DUF5808 domain-containing protein [Chryseobacterium sp. HSC-36S06]|uniref:DUF5808 domain-containing protein n=1 Tax=Chryseobacterium sp. HSC-36S06 TaxID=2910970 RepID=UPI00209F867A|nr:DUF5808 domain-containing protein [Chryseobacterium sp. HSC-36S06]MCP2037585.1 putative membrane protein [Chryseobacterium sp. HSC-36S06]